MISLRTFALILSGLAAFAGLLFLAIPVSTDGRNGPVTCGDGFTGLSDSVKTRDVGAAVFNGPDYGTPLTDACEASISTRRMVGWPLLVVGLAGAAGALFVRSPERAERA